MNSLAVRFACLWIFVAGVAAQPPPASTLSPKENDARFLNTTAVQSLVGEKAGWLATQRSSNEAVKKFGKRMLDDDGTIRGHMKSLLGVRGAIPPGEIDAESARELALLEKLSGEEFDRQFATWAVRNRKAVLREFETAASGASDQEVKTFAQKFLPQLKEHLAAAEALQRTG